MNKARLEIKDLKQELAECKNARVADQNFEESFYLEKKRADNLRQDVEDYKKMVKNLEKKNCNLLKDVSDLLDERRDYKQKYLDLSEKTHLKSDTGSRNSPCVLKCEK